MNSNLAKTATIGALIGVLLIATWFVYSPGLQGPFTLDDGVNIPRTAVGSLDWEEIRKHVFWGTRLGGLSRSLTSLSFALSQFFGGFDPYVFKFQNTMLHLINGALVFWLCSLLLGQVGQVGRDQDKANILSLAVAAIWLLHPLQVSTVLYAVQRLVLLSSLFVLAALITYVKGRIWGLRRPGAAFLLTLGGVSLFGAFGILSKENAALLPLYIAAVELFFFRLVADGPAQKRLLYLLLGVIVVLPIVLAFAYGATHLDSLLSNYINRAFTLQERLLTELHALALYLKLFFLPLPAAMSLFHDNFPIQRQLDVVTAALAVFYVGLVVGAFWLRNSHPAVGFGILWFFLSHLMESTAVPLELVFEHRNYLAILGLSLAVVAGMSRALATPKLKRVAPILVLALTVLLGFNTWARAFVWGNGELWLRTQYQQRPDSLRVLDGLYALELTRGNLDGAQRYLREARKLDPGAPRLMINELRIYCTRETYPVQIAEEARRGIEKNAKSAGLFSALNSLTSSHLAGKCPAVGYQVTYDLVTAYTDSQTLPSERERFLALILQGRLLISSGHWEEAENAYARALDLTQGHPESYSSLTVNELFGPFLMSGKIDSLGRLLQKVAKPPDGEAR